MIIVAAVKIKAAIHKGKENEKRIVFGTNF